MAETTRKTATRKPRAKSVTANRARGEHEITLAGVTYLLRPTFAACNSIEEQLGLSLIEICRKTNLCSLGYADIGIVLREFIVAGASDEMTRTFSAERLAELVFEEGSAGAFARLTLILADVIGGGRDADGNPRAANQT
jgi:hypothetical protein